jgi:hypothetical protein
MFIRLGLAARFRDSFNPLLIPTDSALSSFRFEFQSLSNLMKVRFPREVWKSSPQCGVDGAHQISDFFDPK